MRLCRLHRLLVPALVDVQQQRRCRASMRCACTCALLKSFLGLLSFVESCSHHPHICSARRHGTPQRVCKLRRGFPPLAVLWRASRNGRIGQCLRPLHVTYQGMHAFAVHCLHHAVLAIDELCLQLTVWGSAGSVEAHATACAWPPLLPRLSYIRHTSFNRHPHLISTPL